MSDIRNAYATWARLYKRSKLRHPGKDEQTAFEAGWKARAELANKERSQVDMFAEPAPAWVPVSGKIDDTLDTSVDAAASIRDSRMAQVVRMQVFNAIAERPDTDKGLSDRLGIPENTVRPRRIELTDAGRVASCGTKRNPSGRSANVWRVVQSEGGSKR